MRLKFSQLLIQSIAAFAALAGASVQAQTAFPSKPVRIVYPFAPGGGMEIVTRVMAQDMQKSTGQPFIVDNRTGAGGSIAAAATAGSAPDGYTLFIGPVGIMAITPHLRKLPYDTHKDLIPIARLSEFKSVLVVASQFPAKTAEEFIAYAKANPGKVTYATSGVGSQGHLAGVMLESAWGIKLNHIPYKGAADIVADLLAGRVDVSFDVTMLQYVKQDKARALLVFGDKRMADFPNVPAIGESKLPQVNKDGTWFGAFAPKGTPPAVVEKLAVEFEKALKNPEVQSKMRPYAMTPAYLNPAEFRKLWDAEYDSYGKVIRDNNITVTE